MVREDHESEDIPMSTVMFILDAVRIASVILLQAPS